MNRCLVFVVALLAVLALSPGPVGAADCVATIGPDLRLHIPVLAFDGDTYSLDLQYIPSGDATVWFDVVGGGPADEVTCDNSPMAFLAPDSLLVYVPSIAVGGESYWARLDYTPRAAVPPASRPSGHRAPPRGCGSICLEVKAAGVTREALPQLQAGSNAAVVFDSTFIGRIEDEPLFGRWEFRVHAGSDVLFSTEWPESHFSAPLSSSGSCLVAYPTDPSLSDCSCTFSIPSPEQNRFLISIEVWTAELRKVAGWSATDPFITILGRVGYTVQDFPISLVVWCMRNAEPIRVAGRTINFPYSATHNRSIQAAPYQYELTLADWRVFHDAGISRYVPAFRSYVGATVRVSAPTPMTVREVATEFVVATPPPF